MRNDRTRTPEAKARTRTRRAARRRVSALDFLALLDDRQPLGLR